MKAGQRRGELARERCGGAREQRRLRRPGTTALTWARSPASASSAIEPGADERRARSETISTRARQSPACAARGAARAKITPAPPSSPLPSSAARATMSPRSVTSRASNARTSSPAASSLAHSGARERSSSNASSVETIRISVGDGSGPRLR